MRIALQDTVALSSASSVSLTNFIGSELISALGRLDARHLLGPWTGHVPGTCRRRAKFVPVLYDENHAHEHTELCLLIEGRCVFSYQHAAVVLQPGDLVVCPAGTPHAETFVSAGSGYRLIWWSLHPGEPTLHVTRYRRRGGFTLEYQMSLGALPAEAQRRLATLRQLGESKSTPALESMREAMLTLALALYRRALDGGEAQLDTRAHLVRRAVDYVRKHSHHPLALADVARAVHVSPNYLTSLFRAETGAPLGQFILGERVARAQVLLLAAGASVKTVSDELGFTDQFTFSRAFKRVTGQSPRVWLAAQQ